MDLTEEMGAHLNLIDDIILILLYDE